MITAVVLNISTFEVSETDIEITKTPRGAYKYLYDDLIVKHLSKSNVNSYSPVNINNEWCMVFDDCDYEEHLVVNGFLNVIISSKERRLKYLIDEYTDKIDYFKSKLI